MKDFSITSALGYARLLVILGFCAAYLTGQMPLLEATAGCTVFLGVLGSLGLVAARDASQPEILAETKVISDDKGVRVTVAAKVEEEKK